MGSGDIVGGIAKELSVTQNGSIIAAGLLRKTTYAAREELKFSAESQDLMIL